MIWAVIVLLVLMGTLLLVCLVAGIRYIQLSRLQQAVEGAWFAEGLCTGQMDSTDCRLHAREDLGLPPQHILKRQYDRKLARQLADYVCRMELVERLVEVAPPPGHQQVDLYRPKVGPAFGVAWMAGTTLIVAFRATVTHREVQDDLNARQVEFDTGTAVQ